MPPLLTSMEMTANGGKRYLVRLMAGDDLIEAKPLFPEEGISESPGTYRLVAVLDDSVVGLIQCVETEDTKQVFIDHVAVLPEHRRKGIGTTLVFMVIQSILDSYHGEGWGVAAVTERGSLGDKLMESSFNEDSHPGLTDASSAISDIRDQFVEKCYGSENSMNVWRLQK